MIEMRLTQKVIKGELVIVPNLEDHACWDLALCLVESPEGILTERRIKEIRLEKLVPRLQTEKPVYPGRLQGRDCGAEYP